MHLFSHHKFFRGNRHRCKNGNQSRAVVTQHPAIIILQVLLGSVFNKAAAAAADTHPIQLHTPVSAAAFRRDELEASLLFSLRSKR